MENKKSNKVIIYILTITLIMTSITNVAAIEKERNYRVGGVYHGFKLENEQKLDEYKAISRMFVHKKTGCKVVQFKNNDPNKYFSVTFRTPTKDNKGKAHILEHSLLMGGSEKYPVKQLLNYYLKGSLANEMNGYTYADKTVYPFATINEEEFNNLMDVYLDMVFNARIKSSENIFKEEAWHYEIGDINEPLKYSGVVLNEMKNGSTSSTNRLYHGVHRSLFPDTSYNFISGGDPKYITDLTYEELIEYYETYYHPSNSMVYIYGDTTIESKLEKLDKEILKKFEYKEVDSKIVKQEPFKKRAEYIAEYSIGKKEKNQDIISVNYVIGDSAKAENIIASQLLLDLVLNNKSSDFYKKMCKNGFPNINAGVYAQQAQSVISITSLNTNTDEKHNFEMAVYESLNDVIKNGIDTELLEAILNSYELLQKNSLSYGRDSGESIYHMIALGFVYDEDMFRIFEEEKAFIDSLRKTNGKEYFRKFIENNLIKNEFSSVVVVKGVEGLSEKEALEETDKLKKIKEGLSKKEILEFISSNKELQKWQSSIEPKEILNKLPMVDSNELEPELKLANIIEKEIKGTKVLFHPMDTNGINNVTLRFSSNGVKQEQIPYINLMVSIIKEMDTKSYSNEKLKKMIFKYTDGVSVSTNAQPSIYNKNEYNPVVIVSANSLNENLKESIGLMENILMETNYDNKETLKRIIGQLKAKADINIYRQAGMSGLYKNLSTHSQVFSYMDSLLGLEYYNFLKDINNNFDSRYEEILNTLREVHTTIFNRKNLIVCFTADEKVYPKFQRGMSDLIEELPLLRVAKSEYSFDQGVKREAYIMESTVNYNIQSFDYKSFEDEPTGSFEVLSAIVNDFLWDALRVKGGAYGAYAIGYENGIMAIYTNSDPRIEKSYEDIKGIPEYLANEENYESKLNQYKLDALKDYYVPKSPFQMASQTDNLYFRGKSQEDFKRDIEKILNTTVEDIKSWGKIFERGLNEGRITTIGNYRHIKECEWIFNEVKKYLKEE